MSFIHDKHEKERNCVIFGVGFPPSFQSFVKTWELAMKNKK